MDSRGCFKKKARRKRGRYGARGYLRDKKKRNMKCCLQSFLSHFVFCVVSLELSRIVARGKVLHLVEPDKSSKQIRRYREQPWHDARVPSRTKGSEQQE